MRSLHYDTIASPVGNLVLVVDGLEVCSLDFGDYEPRMSALLQRRFGEVALEPMANPHGYSDRLRAYFGGELAAVETLPANPGGTPFQQQVWQALRTIPPGQLRTYGQLATLLGRPTAARAVGMANSQNPIAIILPCHRVIGANATLTGYAGGLERKAWLLRHEGATLS